VLFSDIRDFTTLSESLEPEELVQFLNEYFNRMTAIIMGEGGTLDKYVGDAIMAFTGAPDAPRSDDAARICRAALRMVDAIDGMNAAWAAKWGRRLRTGVGISTGAAVVGNMGSDIRFDYTAMGDTVNIASRLEGINKEWGTRIIASNATKTAAGEGFVWRPLDEIMLKGKTRGVLAWELIGLSGNERAEWLAASFARLRKALATGRFDEADRLADMILDRVPDDGPTRKLMNRGKAT
jgi:adenylate cyclase